MKQYAIGVGLIVLAVGLLQGRSVGYGLLLDDYSHRAELREGDGSFRSLVDASHLGGHRRRVAMWWQEDADLYFFRPVAFGLMRAEYVVGGWRPAVMHLFSLGWSVVCAALVMILARGATRSAGWSILAGVLFALHPANYLTVRWIACQNEQMATAFVLAGLFFYGQYSGWNVRYVLVGRVRRAAHLVATLSCFVLALGCRESSVVFIGMVLLGDVLLRADRCKGRWGVYVAFAVLLVAYLTVRQVMLGGFEIPGRPYAYPPGTPGFARFVVDKFAYYLLGLFLYVPIVGFGGLRALGSQPLLFYGLVTTLIVVGLFVLVWLRGRRYIWFWVGVALLPLLPVLPVFASSHHLYGASAGMVIAMVAVWHGMMEWSEGRMAWVRKGVRAGIGLLVVLHLMVFSAAHLAYGVGVAGFSAASQTSVNEVVRLSDPLKPNDRLFFINLPMLGFNCIPGIEEETGVRPLKGYVLTFMPAFLGMDQPGYVERVGDRQLRVWLGDDDYFSGLIGESILEAVGRNAPFAVGETFTTNDFSVTVVAGSALGIRELLFTFERSLDDPAYHFFLGSRVFHAFPLRLGCHDRAVETHPAGTP